MKSPHFIQWRDQYPDPRDPLQLLTLILEQLPWLQRWPQVWPEMASSEHGDRDGGWSSALPQRLSVSGDGKRSSPCALKRRGLHCPVRVDAHWVLSLLDLNKVFANMQGVKRTHVTPVCFSELWGCDTKSVGTFHWKNKCPHSKIINAGIWAKVDQTERAGDCWGRENASENQLERILLFRLICFLFKTQGWTRKS